MSGVLTMIKQVKEEKKYYIISFFRGFEVAYKGFWINFSQIYHALSVSPYERPLPDRLTFELQGQSQL